MFPGNAEYVAYERQKDALRYAEQMRLIQTLASQPAEPAHKLWLGMIHWLGSQLVKWGLRLQGESLPLPPAATADSNCC
jgi:hypothetical protein